MKRLFAALLAFMFIFAAAGCGKNNKASGSGSNTAEYSESVNGFESESAEEKAGKAPETETDFTAYDMQGVWIDDPDDPCLVLYVGSDLSYELDYAAADSDAVYLYEGIISPGSYEKEDDSFTMSVTYTDDESFSDASDIGSYLITGFNDGNIEIEQLMDGDTFFSVNLGKKSVTLYKYQ